MTKFKRKMPKVSICIPTWLTPGMHGKYGQNEVYTMANKCLDRMLETVNRDEVEFIIVDNGSTLEGCEEYFNKADVVIKNPANLGFAPAMNQGLNVARGEYIIASNNDILVVGNGWVEKLLKIFEDPLDPPVGLVMPNLIKRQYQLDCLNEKDRLDFDKVLKLEEKDLVLRNQGVWEPGAEFGSMFAMTRDVFQKVRDLNGGYEFYDERFRVGFGEDRWMYRQVRMLGMETYRNNYLRVGHVGNLSMSKLKGDPEIREIIDGNRELLAELKKEHGVI